MGLLSIVNDAVCFGLALNHSLTYSGGLLCNNTPTALTKQGIVQGYIEEDTGNYVYKGIPFAQTTAGANRYVIRTELEK